MIYRPKYFKAWELVDPATYARFGEESLMFLRPELLMLADEVRAFFGVPILINNWHSDGPFHWRGLRTAACTEGAVWSGHRVGGAIDINVGQLKSIDVYHALLEHKECVPHLRRIEDGAVTTGWTHLDVIEHEQPGILIIKP